MKAIPVGLCIWLFFAGSGQTCRADFAGSVISATPQTPILVGESLNITVTVQNTGTDFWLPSPSRDYPSWIAVAEDFSWPISLTSLEYSSLQWIFAGVTDTTEMSMDRQHLPFTPGDYFLTLRCYRPKSAFRDGQFILMDNSPQTVHFTITDAITLPTITGQPVSKTVVQGADATFSVSARGTEPLSFQWRWNGQNLAGATNSTLTLTNVQLAQAGDYTVVASNAKGTTTSSNALLLVLREAGLVGHWPLDENSGSTASDTSGAGNNGTIHNASRVAGQGGSALSFNGTNSYVVIPNHPSLNFARMITLAAWIQPRATDGLRNIVAHDYSLPPAWAVFLRIQDGQYQVGSWNGLTHAASSPVPSGDLGIWVHLAGVYDGSAWKLYRNGQEVSSVQEWTGALPVNGDWAIGATGAGTERFFNGFIDDVRIYSRALSAADIAGLTPATPPRLSILSGPTNGIVQLSLNGETGRTYQIESSTDLAAWTNVLAIVNTNGTVQFSDSRATNRYRFYRAKTSP